MMVSITKELRFYGSQRKFRQVQIIIIGLLSLILIATAFELFSYAQTGGQIKVGSGIYSVLVIALFIMLLCFSVPLQAIEALNFENQGSNLDLLLLSPKSYFMLLIGKLIASVVASLWTIWLVTPLFWLSIYTGGLTINQLFACGLVFFACVSLFSMIGICFALSSNAIQSKARSFATILLITLLPLVLSQTLPIEEALLKLMSCLSPLSVLLSIIGGYPDTSIAGLPLWSWMASLYFIACACLLWFTAKRQYRAR
ncbi:MAG: hypothetical protein OXN17_05500 [Candidatus Poribacteria bacterium]|nr:hypothetical protein [Candidatus Poribacteria bacterium]MDE0504000.1 hypothetical protein [Candidatus Poribacteria bacterium]